MKREVRYILTEEEVTCVGDIRTAKSDLELMSEKIIDENLIPVEYAKFMIDVAGKLAVALEKLNSDLPKKMSNSIVRSLFSDMI